MNDREMLELAAKAAGFNKTKVDDRGWFYVCTYDNEDYSEWEIWEPTNNDGDRYRLAKKLDIRIHFGPSYVTYAVSGVCKTLRWPEDVPDDAYAIVRAAAEIGKAKNA